MVPVLYRYLAHARLRLSRLVVDSRAHRGLRPHRPPPAATRLQARLLRAPSSWPSFRRPPSSRRGEALWEREAAGSGSLGAASSESAAGSVRLRGCGCLLSRPRIRSSRGRAVFRAGVLVGLDGCEVLLCDPCARVRPCVPCVCPGSPRAPVSLNTGTGLCASRLPPVSLTGT